MKELKHFLKSSGIYLVGNILTKAMAFFMLPLYTKYISPTDYGTFDLNVAYITFLISFLYFDIWAGIMRFMFDYEDATDKKKPIVNGLVIFIISTFLFIISVLGLNLVLPLDNIFLLFLYGFTINFQQLVGYIARAFGENLTFAVGGVVASLTMLVLNIVLIVYFKFDYSALYISNIVGLVFNSIIIMKKIHFFSLLKISNLNYQLFKEMMIFSVPLSLNSVAYWFLTGFNRIIISSKLSVFDNGLYAVATKFSAIIQLMVTCFQMAWQELTFSKANSSKDELGKFYTRASNAYIEFLLVGIIICLPIIKVVFPYFINGQYSEAEKIIPLALLATVMSSFSSFLGSICSTLKMNKYIFSTTLWGALVNVLIISLSIPIIGIQSANISLFFGFLIVCIRRIKLLQKFLEIKINVKKISFMLGVFFISTFLYIYLSVIINVLSLIVVLIMLFLLYKNTLKNILLQMK